MKRKKQKKIKHKIQINFTNLTEKKLQKNISKYY